MTDKNPDLRHDAWERFERAVDAGLRTPPKRKPTDKPKKKGPKKAIAKK